MQFAVLFVFNAAKSNVLHAAVFGTFHSSGITYVNSLFKSVNF